jgi:hypothetical protein
LRLDQHEKILVTLADGIAMQVDGAARCEREGRKVFRPGRVGKNVAAPRRIGLQRRVRDIGIGLR